MTARRARWQTSCPWARSPSPSLDEKLGSDFVRENCGVKFDFMLDRLMRSARGFDMRTLERAVRLCAETDYAMKSGGDGAEQLTLLLIRLAAGEDV